VKRGEVNLHAANRALPSKRKADPGAAYEPKTDHQKKRAVIQKERMISALSNVTGLCRGLADELDLPMALSVCSKEDRDMVIDRAHESAKHLRAFIAKIERTDNA
jgi:hypothetical protein